MASDVRLVCLGAWPRADATLWVTRSTWTGLGLGHGHLVARQVEVVVRAGASPRTVSLWLPAPDQRVLVTADEADVEVAPDVRAVS